MLGSTVAFLAGGGGIGGGGRGGGGGLTYSQLDEAHQLYMPLPSSACPELKHATLSRSHLTRHSSHVTRHTSHVTRHPSHACVCRFIERHAVLSPPAASAPASCLCPNTYKLNAAAWQHAHSLLAHTALHHGSSLLSLARCQYEACVPRDVQSFDELLRGRPVHTSTPFPVSSSSSSSSSSPSSPLSSLQCLLSNESLHLLKSSLVDLWLLMQVGCVVCCVSCDVLRPLPI